MAVFTGQLRPNEIFSSLFNQIISIQTFADNISGLKSTLADKFRVDGSLYGDAKVYTSTDVLKSVDWVQDSQDAINVLALHRPPAPKQQVIYLDKFRQIALTVDNYLSKRAWGSEDSFAQFQSVILAWIRDTKKVYDTTLVNSYIGTTETNVGNQIVTVTFPVGDSSDNVDMEAANRLTALEIGESIANLFSDIQDVSRDYNDNQFLRAFNPEDMMVVWNSKYHNMIRKIDLPTIFHKEGIVDKFDEDVINYRYFGTVITSSNISDYSASTPAAGKPIASGTGAYTPGSNNANGTIRSLVEKEVTVSNTDYHVFPGDEIPAGATIIATTGDFLPGEVYIATDDVICKVMYEKAVPFMSAFEVETSFYNARNLSENHYLTWGYSTPQYLANYPFVTIKKA